MAKTFLEAGHEGLLVAGLDIDDAVRLQPGVAERRGEQVRPRDTPEHRAGQASDDPGREQRGGRAAYGVVAAAGHLVKGSQGQTSAGERSVQSLHLERKHADRSTVSLLQCADLCAQTLELGRTGGRHGRAPPVSIMFPKCSGSKRMTESIRSAPYPLRFAAAPDP